ncbi:hypothetical protein [Leptospira koniambonensis]|uniref:hypothetical protein n=1 Tax=Leptospira koniambonensis TaxID=2484950 RepID=UPI003EB84826
MSFFILFGAIIEFDFPNIPSTYMTANGQAISRITYSSLWNLVHRTIAGLVPATDRIQSTSHGLSAGQLVKKTRIDSKVIGTQQSEYPLI